MVIGMGWNGAMNKHPRMVRAMTPAGPVCPSRLPRPQGFERRGSAKCLHLMMLRLNVVAK